MRILFVYSTQYPVVRGGVDRMIVSLVDELKLDHDVMLFSVKEPSEQLEKNMKCSIDGGIKTYSMPIRLPFYSRFSVRNFVAWMFEFPRSVYRVRQLMRRERIDIIHMHMLNRYTLAFVANRKFWGTPYIVTLHGSEVNFFNQQNRVTRAIGRLILRNAASVVAVSEKLTARARQIFEFVKDVKFIPNGVALAQPLKTSGIDLAKEIGIELPARYFTIIGTLDTVKGQDVAIRAWKQVRKLDPDLHLFLVGSGPMESEWVKLAEVDDEKKNIHFTGRLTNKIALALASNGFGLIIPSRAEGLPYVLLEAGALGLPVICSDIEAFTSTVEHDIHVVTTPVEDVAALSSAVVHLVEDRRKASRLGTSLGELVSEKYSAARMAAAYQQVYADVAEPKSA